MTVDEDAFERVARHQGHRVRVAVDGDTATLTCVACAETLAVFEQLRTEDP